MSNIKNDLNKVAHKYTYVNLKHYITEEINLDGLYWEKINFIFILFKNIHFPLLL